MPDSVNIRGTNLREWERIAKFLGRGVDEVLAMSGSELLQAHYVEIERRRTMRTRPDPNSPDPRNLASREALKSGAK